jgi:D-serine deaminase-like pyridoxal phosphate-dependent protein
VDLDALDRNVDRLVAAAGGRPIRVATKSVRHPGLLRRIAARGGITAVMPYCAPEAELLVKEGFRDLLIAYPIGRSIDAELVAELVAAGAEARCVVDAVDQVDLLARAARARGVTVPVCLDVDLSLRIGPAHLGVRRSPIRSAADAVAVGRAVREAGGLALVGVLAYEAQIAGIRDRGASGWRDPARALVKARSRPLAVARRAEIVGALRADGHDVGLVNGGGTGSAAFTAGDPTVTEIAVGSGFLCSHLFDGYDGLPLEPALFFALPVVRRSDPGFVTCAGGGYPASGSAGEDRLPVVVFPEGLAPLGLEGFGEVQTPLRWTGSGPPPALGDPVLCRPAKAGEIAERFATYLLVRDGAVVAEEPTYRGMGACFP